jgi:hypothetical protein
MTKKINRRQFIGLSAGAVACAGLYTYFTNPLRVFDITRSPDNKTVLFLHIPKTGGTTLREHVNRNVAPEKLFLSADRLQLQYAKDAYSKHINQYDVMYFRGHFSLNNQVFLNDYKDYTECVSILRDPVARFSSSYRYMMSNWDCEGMYGETLRNAKLKNLVDVIEYVKEEVKSEIYPPDMQFHMEVDNGMTRRLSDAGDTVPFGQVTRDMLEQAKRNLETRFSVIGITEEYNKFLWLLVNKYGWDINPSIRRNVNKKRAKPTRAERNAVLSINQFDIELYNHAKILSARMFNELGAKKAQEYEAFLSMDVPSEKSTTHLSQSFSCRSEHVEIKK